MPSEIADIDELQAYAVKLCTSQLYKIGKGHKTHQAFWPFVAPQNACEPYLEEMTKFNACATYKGLPRAKTVLRQ